METHRPRISTILPLVSGVLGDSHREQVVHVAGCSKDTMLETCRDALDGQEMNGRGRRGINLKTQTRKEYCRYCESRKCRLTGGKEIGQELSTLASNSDFLWQ